MKLVLSLWFERHFFLYMIWKTLLILWLRYKTLNCFPNEWKSLIITLHHVKRDDQLNIGCVHSCRQAGRLNRPTAWQKKTKLYNSHGASQLALKSIVVFVSFLFSCRDFVSIWPSYFIKACALALTLINHTIVFNSIDQ